MILSCRMSVLVSGCLNRPQGFPSRQLPKLQHLYKNPESSSARVRECQQTRVVHQKGHHQQRWTRGRSLFVGVHAQVLTYSTVIRHQRSTPLLRLPRILNLAPLPRINMASTLFPTSLNLSRDLRCVHQITILQSTHPLPPPTNHQHSYRPIFQSHLPCHCPKQLLCTPVRATQASAGVAARLNRVLRTHRDPYHRRTPLGRQDRNYIVYKPLRRPRMIHHWLVSA
jgi:hypothetical protein